MRLPLPARPVLHVSDRPSSTAQWTTLGRALELNRPAAQRIVTDEYAPLFLTGASRVVLTQLTLAGPAVRAVERAPFAGLSAFGLCRHRFIDEHLRTALELGAEQVLVLGAGYDTRAYRFADEIAGRPVYEVDLPPLSRRKAAIVAAHPERFAHASIHRVEIDFRTESLAERLDASGFATGRRTFVAWEGVTPYLDRSAVAATLDTLAQVTGPGSRLALDLWRGTTGGHGIAGQLRRAAAHAFVVIGEPLAFGLPPDAARHFLAEHGFGVGDLAEHDDLAARYSTDGRPCDEAVYVAMAELGG